MRLIAKVIGISRAKFHCNRLTTVQDIQDYASLIFWHTVYNKCLDVISLLTNYMSRGLADQSSGTTSIWRLRGS